MSSRMIQTIITSFLLSFISSATAAEISLVKVENKLVSLTHHLHIEGKIEAGDSDKVRKLMIGLPEGSEASLVVSLNSPGGDLSEGMAIARLLLFADMQVVTDVLTRTGKPANCASACSLIYLGGKYRFLQEGSRLGVHQFRYIKDGFIQRSTNTQQVQLTSAEITDLLSKANIDPGFFTLMAKTTPEEIHWVDLETLEALNVVNREVAFQENNFTFKKGDVKLVMTHLSLFGINRLSGQCLDDNVIFTSEIGLSDILDESGQIISQEKINSQFRLTVMADRYSSSPTIVSAARLQDTALISQFTVPAQQLAAMITANRIDVRLVQKNGAFIGAGFDVMDGQMRDLIESCTNLPGIPTSSLGGERDLEQTLSPVFVATQLSIVNVSINPYIGIRPSSSPEEQAITLYTSYLEAWSKRNDQAMNYIETNYAKTISYYGSMIPKEKLIKEKQKFANDWPIRDYFAIPNTYEIKCEDGTCLIAAVIKWSARNDVKRKTATGGAWYSLGFNMITGEVLFEDGHSQKM